MRDTDIAWCAGFFDGEGHVSYKRSYPSSHTGKVSPMLPCSVPQSSDNIEVLEFFQITVGLGKLKGPYKTVNGNPQHRLIFGINEVDKLFIILKPYLKSEKTKNFQRALMEYWTHNPEATEEDYVRALKRNKKKGCPKCKEEWNGLVCSNCGFIM